MALKLVSVNIERSKHLDRVVPFIEREKPDVLCVQELMHHDVETIGAALAGSAHSYFPMSRLTNEHPGALFGLGVFSTLPIRARSEYPYVTWPELPATTIGEEATFNNENRAVLLVDVELDSAIFRIGTTHLTWTPDGSVTDLQRRDVGDLLKVLDGLGEFVLCGDFNAPRGRDSFARLAEKYRDNIPSEYTTSIDKDLHRAGNLQLMVDGLFSTPGYRCENVRLVSGVSDHMAIVADVNVR